MSPSQRFRAIFHAPGRLQFGEDLVLNLTNRSLFVDIGHVYDVGNDSQLGDLFCGAGDSIVEADDVEVLFPLGKCILVQLNLASLETHRGLGACYLN